MKARQIDKGKNVRYFKIAPLNFDANSYTALIVWHGNKVTEPPLTENMTDEDIENHIFQRTKITFENFPCHTQAVERLIKEVTDSSLKVRRSEAQNGNISPDLNHMPRYHLLKVKLTFNCKHRMT